MIDVLTAVSTAEGDETKMITESAETNENAAAVAEQGAQLGDIADPQHEQ